jgi:hypothetical protein
MANNAVALWRPLDCGDSSPVSDVVTGSLTPDVRLMPARKSPSCEHSDFSVSSVGGSRGTQRCKTRRGCRLHLRDVNSRRGACLAGLDRQPPHFGEVRLNERH